MILSQRLRRGIMLGGVVLAMVLGILALPTPPSGPPSLALAVEAAPMLQTSEPITATAEARRSNEAILLSPFSGPSNTPITAMGQNWQPGQRVLINLIDNDTETPYAVASTIASEDGTFSVSFFIPVALADQPQIVVLAEALDGSASARAFYTISDIVNQPVIATTTPETLITPEPDGVVTAGRLNVREGPGVLYPVVGQVERGQDVDISGQNGGWWRIDFLHGFGDYGWVSGDFVRVNDVEDVPFIAVPPPPQPTATPTPTPTPMPQMVCNPGQWSGCSPSFCPVEYVSQCTAEGQWGQCVWDPGSCSVYNDDNNSGDNDDDGDNDSDDDNDDEDDSSDEDDEGDDNDDSDDNDA